MGRWVSCKLFSAGEGVLLIVVAYENVSNRTCCIEDLFFRLMKMANVSGYDWCRFRGERVSGARYFEDGCSSVSGVAYTINKIFGHKFFETFVTSLSLMARACASVLMCPP